MKLEIDVKSEDDEMFVRFHFRQEGMPGMRLLGCWLREFVEALEKPFNPERVCVYQDYHVVNTKLKTEVFKSSIETPLLSIDAGQRAKLIAHLKSTYAALL